MPIIPHLVVDEYGSFVSKKQGRLRVTVKQEKRVEAPLMHLETVLISGHGVSLSADAMAACAEQGIPIHVIDRRGAPLASMYAVCADRHCADTAGSVAGLQRGNAVWRRHGRWRWARFATSPRCSNTSPSIARSGSRRLYDDLREAATAVLEHEQELLRLTRRLD